MLADKYIRNMLHEAYCSLQKIAPQNETGGKQKIESGHKSSV